MEYSIEKFETGYLMVNTWVFPLSEKSVAVIDPGGLSPELSQYLDKLHPTHLEIMLTHGHFDHVGGLPALVRKYSDYRLWIHEKDAAYLGAAGTETHFKSFAPLHVQTALPCCTPPGIRKALFACGAKKPVFFSAVTLFFTVPAAEPTYSAVMRCRYANHSSDFLLNYREARRCIRDTAPIRQSNLKRNIKGRTCKGAPVSIFGRQQLSESVQPSQF